MISYSIDNDRKFQAGIERAKAIGDDLRAPFTLISKDFYRSQSAIFNLKSRGKYDDLKQSTKDHRERNNQPIYPILVGPDRGTHKGGALKRAASVQGVAGNITLIGKQLLAFGIDPTIVPHAIYHQSNSPRTGKLPQRKMLFIGPEAPRFANDDTKGRLERWLNIMNSFVLQKLKQQGFNVGEL